MFAKLTQCSLWLEFCKNRGEKTGYKKRTDDFLRIKKYNWTNSLIFNDREIMSLSICYTLNTGFKNVVVTQL